MLLIVVGVGLALYRRLSGSRGSDASGRTHQHGTPDHWPPVVRKPGSQPVPGAAAAPASSEE